MDQATKPSQEPRPAILLTGVTGALGSALLPNLLRRYDQYDFICIVRAPSADAATRRIQEVIAQSIPNQGKSQRVQAWQGDVTLPRFGLADEAYCTLTTSTERIFHLAASVDFNAALDESRIANVDSTQHVLRFARDCRQLSNPGFRLNYVSTAYVAGDRRGKLNETALRCDQGFWNSYEQTKLEAEELVEHAKSDVPLTIYRPSQIIGNSESGQIAKFWGFYEFIGLAVRGRSNILVADANARPDMVPSDYICAALLHLGERADAIGKTFHLAAGLANSLSVTEVVDAVLEVIDAYNDGKRMLSRPLIISADRLEQDASGAELKRYNSSAQKLLMRTYQPYLSYERDFNVDATHKLLGDAGIRIPAMRDAIKITAKYALISRTRPLATSIS